MIKTVMLTAVALLIAAAPVSADSVVHLNGHGGLKWQYDYTVDGVEIDVTASSYNPYNGNTYNSYVGQYSNGMGVTNTGNRDAHFVDGSGWKDTIWFTFDACVEFTGAKFTYVDHYNDEVDVVDADGSVLGSYNLSHLRKSGGHAYLDLSDKDFSGEKFGLRAYDSSDDWKVKAIKFHEKITAIPSPAAAGTGLAMLGGLVLRRRRQEG